MSVERHDQDPYAAPPLRRDKKGPLLRVVLIAAMLGLGVWGYTQFNDPNAPALVAQEEMPQTQQMADGTYDVTPTPAAPAAAPATTPAPAAIEPQTQQRSAPVAPPAEPVPPPSTTIGASPAG